ncbi:MAG: hypothetical protein AAF943_11490 [Pseudomonadota bacterium]
MKHTDPRHPNTVEKAIKKRPSVHFDWLDWLPYLADADMTNAEKQEHIETLWALVLGFVDLGFAVGSDEDNCGEAFDLKDVLAAAVLNSGENKEDAA